MVHFHPAYLYIPLHAALAVLLLYIVLILFLHEVLMTMFFCYSDRGVLKTFKPWFFFLLAIAFSVSDKQ